METLEIKKEAALKAHQDASNKGKQLLENLLGKKTFLKEVTERIKTMDDVLQELGEQDQDVIDYRILQKPGVSDHIIGNQEAILIAKALNEGYTPDWDKSDEYKYYPWFKMSSSGFRSHAYARWTTHSDVGSRLCFKSSKLAKYAGEQFTEVYRKFMIIE
ncbi:hypothetical protein [Aquimarina macrocephali]|uniref:hypothetical protein n=1 Tax=Aquimarina macrocephali TaxID=666563 RepID=UPI003F672106